MRYIQVENGFRTIKGAILDAGMETMNMLLIGKITVKKLEI